jgi:hypothetical protein
MSVVNVKVKYIRPEYQNLEEWMNDTNNVYIGRAGVVFIGGKRYPPKQSIFANPYKVGRDGTREEVIKKYDTYIRDRIEKDQDVKSRLLKLRGKNLGCWCKPEACHGDILLKLIEEYSN